MSRIRLFAILVLAAFFLGRCGDEIIRTRPHDTEPVISSQPVVSQITYSSALIDWTTEEPCSIRIQYWFSGGDTLTQSDPEYRQNHSTLLVNLSADAAYSYRILCIDQYDNIAQSDVLTFATIIDYSGFINAGWQNFETKQFAGAVTYFSDYLSYEPTCYDALLGAGWSSCRTGSLTESVDYFVQCLEQDASDNDAIAGLTLSAFRLNYYSDAIHYGRIIQNQVLEFWNEIGTIGFDPADSLYYVFEHDSSFDNLDVALMLADSYFQTGNTDNAQSQMNFLLPLNGVHESDSASWTINSVTYDNYHDALGGLIDSLENVYWQNGQNP